MVLIAKLTLHLGSVILQFAHLLCREGAHRWETGVEGLLSCECFEYKVILSVLRSP